MKIQEQLNELYLSKWENYCMQIKPIVEGNFDVKPTNPLLISPNNDYESADIRVMIFGQETNDWEKIFNPNSNPNDKITELLNVYNQFYNLAGYVSHRRRHFWDGFRLFKKILGDKYPNKRISYVWNNIIKIGKAGNPNNPPEFIYNIERNYFSVVEEEIKILKPHIILFLTGPNYDEYIKYKLPNAIIKQLLKFPIKKMAKVQLSNVNYAYRTYHPRYLYMQKDNAIEAYFLTIVNDINI